MIMQVFIRDLLSKDVLIFIMIEKIAQTYPQIEEKSRSTETNLRAKGMHVSMVFLATTAK